MQSNQTNEVETFRAGLAALASAPNPVWDPVTEDTCPGYDAEPGVEEAGTEVWPFDAIPGTDF